jgi:hypothetical protein
MSSIFYECR